jgi:hypothetical protein
MGARLFVNNKWGKEVTNMYAMAKPKGTTFEVVEFTRWFKSAKWLVEYCASIQLQGMNIIEDHGLCEVYHAITPCMVEFYLLKEV